jgi:hypothetical protein
VIAFRPDSGLYKFGGFAKMHPSVYEKTTVPPRILPTDFLRCRWLLDRGQHRLRQGSLRERQLNIGIIGTANRPKINIAGVERENIVALCDVDDNFLTAAKERGFKNATERRVYAASTWKGQTFSDFATPAMNLNREAALMPRSSIFLFPPCAAHELERIGLLPKWPLS